jgi:hypothetical protein
MTLWATKGMGILFGGVTDEDTNEETLDSVFWNDLQVRFFAENAVWLINVHFRYGYQLSGKGRWSSMALKKPKVKGAKSKGVKKKQKDKDAKWKEQNSSGEEENEGEDEVCPSFYRDLFLTTVKLTGSAICGPQGSST